MNIKNLTAIFFLFFSSVGQATSITDAYNKVEEKWVQAQKKSSLKKAYSQYVKRNPISALSEDDMNIFRSLIADGNVTAFNLNCQGTLTDSASRSLNESSENPISPVCENGVKHIFGSVLRPRILNLTYANGINRQITIGLKKPASGFCSAIENQMGLFLTSVNTGYSDLGTEETAQFHAKDTSASSILEESRTQRLGMALYRCCQPVDNSKPNCLEKIREALITEGADGQMNSH